MSAAAEYIESFETGGVSEFHHRDHVRLAWCYLREWPLLEAIDRFSRALKAFATRAGQSSLYHETITCAYLLLIRDRMKGEVSFETFADLNPDLFAWKPSILDRYYRAETLWSERARETFVLPDSRLTM